MVNFIGHCEFDIKRDLVVLISLDIVSLTLREI